MERNIRKLECNRQCVGKCCENTMVALKDEDHAKWFAYHGQKVYRIKETGEYRGLLPIKCQFLTEDKKCALYNKPERPKMCGEYWCDEAPTYEEIKFEV